MSWRNSFLSAFLLVLTVVCSRSLCLAQHYPIVDTGQERCYDNRLEIDYPKEGEPFFGQDAHYQGNEPSYRDNGDGTITDLVTELMWQKDPGPKKTFQEAVAGASVCRVGGYDDWRLPSIKELYSLILFSGEDIDPQASDTSDLKPFINNKYFGFVYGDPAKGERVIDSQMATSTKYVSTTMHGNETMFGVNFADGRIKGYPTGSGGRPGRPSKGYYVFYVRGNAEYGKNDFHDNADGTVTDRATGLIWAKVDSGHLKAGKNKDGKLNWEQALRWAEDLQYAGHSDWRLPNAKELQSIVDYTRSPDTTRSAAIDPVFSVTPIRDALGEVNYPFYWSSTTHNRMGGGEAAVYVAFGRSQGWMRGFGGQYDLLDVHGAGSQRSDPKAGDPSQFPRGRGPQGDVIDIYNMVRPVRGGEVSFRESGPELEPQRSGRRGRGPDQRGPGGMGPGGMGLGRQGPGGMGPGGMGPGGMGLGRQGPGGMGPGGPMGRDRPGFVSRLDRDGDGKVSRKEFDGPPEAFDHLDANGDGYLHDSEGPLGPPPGEQPGGRGGPGQRPGQPPASGSGESTFESEPIPKDDVEKKILAMLKDLDQNQRRGMMNVPEEDSRLLRLLTETADAKNVVEIGTSNGYSGIWFALALRTTGGKLITHELDAGRASQARENFKRAGVEQYITLVEGDAHEEVKKLKGPIDILFLDADKEGYIDYLDKLLPLVRPGGLIVAHNMNTRQAHPPFVKAITTNPDLETLFVHMDHSGVAISMKKR